MALTLSHFRFGVAELAEATHGWLAAEDKPLPLMPPARPFLLRFCVQANGTGLNNVDNEFQYRHNGGTWTNITTTSDVVRTGSTSVFTNGQNCTKRLSGTGTFEASAAGCTHDGTSGGTANDIVASGNSETEIGLQILGADTAIGDLIEFRLTRDGGVLLDAYAVVPSLRVGVDILAAGSQDNTQHFSASAGVTRINGAQVTIACSGMSASDLADAGLSITMSVWGTTDTQPSPPPENYTVHLYGPDVWSGGNTGKDGMPITPGFAFSQDIPEGVKRVRASFQPSRTAIFGADATIVEIP